VQEWLTKTSFVNYAFDALLINEFLDAAGGCTSQTQL
jgi:hypothetical protein